MPLTYNWLLLYNYTINLWLCNFLNAYKENEKWDECFISLDKRECEAFLKDVLNWYSEELESFKRG